MTPFERVVKSMRREKADRLPVFPILSGVTRNLIGVNYKEWATNADLTAKAFIKAQEDFDLDCFVTLTDLSVEAADFGQEIVYPLNEAAHPDYNNYFLKSVEDYAKIKYVDPRASARMGEHIKLCKKLVEAKGGKVPVVAFIFGPLGILSMLRGQENLYIDLYDAPDEVKKACGTINEVLIEYSRELIRAGVNAIMIDTLFASASIMGKDMWDEFEGPFVQEWADIVHGLNTLVMVHNCGAKVYFDVQIKRMRPHAISFWNVPDDCRDYYDCKKKYGDKTMLIGTIAPTGLPLKTKEEVIAETKKNVEWFGERGGCIIATGCEYPANLPLDHAKTIIDTVKSIGDNYYSGYRAK